MQNKVENAKDQVKLANIRHSLAHLLAAAVLELYPDAKRTIGPAIENGFYFDFADLKISDEDLPKIEKKMREILPTWKDTTCEMVEKDQALKEYPSNPFKAELINEFSPNGEPLSFYKNGTYWDLCKGGHSDHPAAEIDPESFTLHKIAGAYWRGDEKNSMLTRIYGLAFENKAALDAYLTQQEEAKKRDHRILGKELKLFTFSDLVGPGLPLWTPRGTIIREELNDFVWSLRKKQGYQKVTIPHITKNDLYIKSGHWAKYAEDLFKIDTRDGHMFCMKPMNCPHHAQIYASEMRSYKELPLRFCETTMVYRDEQSGELSGLQRVLSITQDDAHVFCRESQLENEVEVVWNIVESFYSTFGFTLTPRFSRRDPKTPEKYMGTDEGWDKAEQAIKTIITKKAGDAWVDGPGEAAFYGPKVDFMAKDSIGRTWQVATIQLDFVQPANFSLEFVNEEGKREQPVMIHCAIMGAIERFMSILIENTAGNFPLWLSPVQVSIIPIAESHHEYAVGIEEKLRALNIRTEVLSEKDGLGKKIKKVREMKTPYWLVIGDKDIEAGKVTLESRDAGQVGQISLEDLINKLTTEIKEKK
jgi:threonyl-tRNA synthetase